MTSYVGLPVLEQYLKFPELHVLGRYPLKCIQNATDAYLVENRLIGLMPTLQQFTCRCSILYTARTIIIDHITSQLEIENK